MQGELKMAMIDMELRVLSKRVRKLELENALLKGAMVKLGVDPNELIFRDRDPVLLRDQEEVPPRSACF